MENSLNASHPPEQPAAGKTDDWCRLFVDSPQYRRAMQDARYTRQEAAIDFLRGYCQHTGQVQPTPVQLPVWTDLIVKNYYRFF